MRTIERVLRTQKLSTFISRVSLRFWDKGDIEIEEAAYDVLETFYPRRETDLARRPIPKDATQRVGFQGKVWDVPIVLPFSGEHYKHGWHIVNVVAWGCPRKGEYYLSGGPVEVWKTPNDLNEEFLIVQPGKRVVGESFWVIEEE
jgi:hypothetical protein